MGVSTQSTWGPANNTNFTLITRSISFITHIPQIRVFVTIMSKSFQAKVKVLPNVRKANDSSSTIQRARRIAMLILALCVTDVHSSQANPGKMETAPGLPKDFRRLSEPSCPCPGRKHELLWSDTPIGCNMCQRHRILGTLPKGTMMYGCRECNWDACDRCYESKLEFVPRGVGGFGRLPDGCPCPGRKHKLEWSKIPIGCDMCELRCSSDTFMFYGCRECDWDACKSCYKKCFEKPKHRLDCGPAFSTRPDRLEATYRTFD